MNKLQEQERDPAIRTLRDVLRTAPRPVRDESEWESVEQAIFTRLDSPRSAPRVLHRSEMFRSTLRPALAAAAVLVIVVNIFVFTRPGFSPASRSLEQSSILDIKGTVDMVHKDVSQTLDNQAGAPIRIGKGQRFETRDDGSMMVQLMEGTGFRLSRNSAVSVIEAEPERIALFLHHGDILFSVGKRAKGESFLVRTPNADCRVVGTIFQVEVQPGVSPDKARTDLAVYEGTVRINDRRAPRVSASVQTGHMVSLSDRQFNDVYSTNTQPKTIHTISMLTLALTMARDTLAAPSGLIEIRSVPHEARVVVNDQVMGTTPLVFKYPAGTVDIALEMPGYESWKQTVHVERMRTSIIDATLARHARRAPSRAAATDSAPRKKPSSANQTGGNEFINHPEYVEALVQMTIGEYRKALAALEPLLDQGDLSPLDRVRVMEQISLCYRSLGDFRTALRGLERTVRWSKDPAEKSNALWEMATIRFTCLGDYEGAEENLREYLAAYPDGPWADQAREKLGEVQLMMEFSASSSPR